MGKQHSLNFKGVRNGEAYFCFPRDLCHGPSSLSCPMALAMTKALCYSFHQDRHWLWGKWWKQSATFCSVSDIPHTGPSDWFPNLRTPDLSIWSENFALPLIISPHSKSSLMDLLLKAWPLWHWCQIKSQGFRSSRKDSFIALPGKGRHTGLLPRKPCVSLGRIWWSFIIVIQRWGLWQDVCILLRW